MVSSSVMFIQAQVIAIAACMVAFGAATGVWGQQDLINQAHRLDLAGKPDAAITLYREALEQDADSFDAHYGIARVLDLTGHYEDARRHFGRAIELAPEGVKDQALRMMGVSYAFTGDVSEASRYFRQVFERQTASGNFVSAAEVANELGRVYLESGDLDSASRWYRMGYVTAAREPTRSTPENDLADLRWAHAQARIAARRGDKEEARRQEAAFKELLDRRTNPDQQIQYPYLLGYVDFYLKEYSGAVDELRKADASDPFILVLLGEAYEKLGNQVRAHESYRKALASTSHAVNNAFARGIARQKLQDTR
jgi:tetratricopeptide (TPR) repeat protein